MRSKPGGGELIHVCNITPPRLAALATSPASGEGKRLRRRSFLALLGVSAAWPLSARAQQGERGRRIGVLSGVSASNADSQQRYGAFLEKLRQLGWIDGRNVRVEARWGDVRKNAAELIALAPDVVVTLGGTSVQALLQATSTIPIVFAIVQDPVGAGFVASLSEPGGNATGFMLFEYSLAGKWLELLKEIAPGVTRAGVIREQFFPSGIGQFAVIQSVSQSVGVEVVPINIEDAAELERGIATFARSASRGLIVTAGPKSQDATDLIVALAAKYKLPTVYVERHFVAVGGLISYGPNYADEEGQAAVYVDRILKGARPADLPVQAPTKYELVVNLKTAKALGLSVPQSILGRADEVIE